MKNRHFELRRRFARQYHRNKQGHYFDQGIRIRRDYSEVNPSGLSWWDDVQFILGGMRVEVAWQHPRHVYEGLVKEAAQQATEHPYEKIEGDLFDGAEKSYKQLGRSRKKVVSYTTTNRPGQDEWFEALRVEEARLSRDADYTIVPSIKVEQLA
ncbi:hypothetical protein [Chitinimonas sp.]|uniref:hypothetical protein n=1 Tax=Chitinimonas sp. TaxID=1934313 RepID=UPI0035B1A281